MWGGAHVPCRRWNLLSQDPALPFFIGLFYVFGKGGCHAPASPPAKTPAVPHRLEKGLAGVVVSFRCGELSRRAGRDQGLGESEVPHSDFFTVDIGNLNNDIASATSLHGDTRLSISLFHIVNL